jgi:hypothetical protein
MEEVTAAMEEAATAWMEQIRRLAGLPTSLARESDSATRRLLRE